MHIFIQQSYPSSAEDLAVRRAARLRRIPVRSWKEAPEATPKFPEIPFLPVGDTRYCLAAFAHQGITVRREYPRYPGTLLLPRFLPQQLWIVSLTDLLEDAWPQGGWEVSTIHREPTFPENQYAHPKELLQALYNAIPDRQLWPKRVQIVSPLQLASRWRYYVIDGEIRGASRFDAGGDIAPVPNLALVQEAIARLQRLHQLPAGCALDFGVLMNLRTSLFLGLRDGWALPAYPGSLSPESYLELLEKRHAQILQEKQLTLPPLRTWEGE